MLLWHLKRNLVTNRLNFKVFSIINFGWLWLIEAMADMYYIIFIRCTNKKNSKQFECYTFIINRDKIFWSHSLLKKRGCQVPSPVCIHNAPWHPKINQEQKITFKVVYKNFYGYIHPGTYHILVFIGVHTKDMFFGAMVTRLSANCVFWITSTKKYSHAWLNIVYTINRWSLDHTVYRCTLYNTGGICWNIVYTINRWSLDHSVYTCTLYNTGGICWT